MSPGYSGKPLAQKLGIKKGFIVAVVDPPENYYELLGPLPDDVSFQELGSVRLDFLHVFATERAALEEELPRLKESMKPNGMIWVSWPKRASKVTTDLDENVIRELALDIDLVDVKVAAVDETWSSLKLVIRLKDRK